MLDITPGQTVIAEFHQNGKPDTSIVGEVVSLYTGEYDGWKLPMAELLLRDGSKRYVMRGSVKAIVESKPVALHLIPNRIGTSGTGRDLPTPLFVHVASPVEYIALDWKAEETETGVVCGTCSDTTRSWMLDGNGGEFEVGRRQVRHASVAHVRECHAETERQAQEQAAEIWAEGAWLRWAEGGWDPHGAYSFDPYDRAA